MAPPAADIEDEIKDEKNPPPLDEDDIALLKTYVLFLSLILNPNFHYWLYLLLLIHFELSIFHFLMLINWDGT